MSKKPAPRNSPKQVCPDGQYWISPHQRKRIDKNGKPYIQQVKGYCCCHPGLFQKIADEEKIPVDYLYFALTVYGEARSENDASMRAISWIVQNRFAAKKGGDSYKKIVLRPSQFSCWNHNDSNFERLTHPGKDDPFDERAWQRCKMIAEEVRNAPKDTNPIPEIYNYFSGKPKKKWQEHYFDLPDVPKFHFVKLKK